MTQDSDATESNNRSWLQEFAADYFEEFETDPFVVIVGTVIMGAISLGVAAGLIILFYFFPIIMLIITLIAGLVGGSIAWFLHYGSKQNKIRNEALRLKRLGR